MAYVAGLNGSGAAQSVQVTVERGARNSRRLYASVQIAAPVEVVWGALTDYQGLGNFIPGVLSHSMHARTVTLPCQAKFQENYELLSCR